MDEVSSTRKTFAGLGKAFKRKGFLSPYVRNQPAASIFGQKPPRPLRGLAPEPAAAAPFWPKTLPGLRPGARIRLSQESFGDFGQFMPKNPEAIFWPKWSPLGVFGHFWPFFWPKRAERRGFWSK